MDENYNAQERRGSARFDYAVPLGCKVCKKETISKLLEGYTANISSAGLLCSIKEKVSKDDILWLAFDRQTLDICEEIEKRVFIYQNGIIGKVVRIHPKEFDTYDVGIRFITREERDSSNIYPEIHFLFKGSTK